MTSLRQLVEFKGAVQSVPKIASDNPHIHFWQSPHSVGLRRAKGSVNPLKCCIQSFSLSLCFHFLFSFVGYKRQNAGSFYPKRTCVWVKTSLRSICESFIELGYEWTGTIMKSYRKKCYERNFIRWNFFYSEICNILADETLLIYLRH